MPRLDEGSLLITTRKLPGISLPDSLKVSEVLRRPFCEFPEVRGVVTKLGRPDLATEAMGVYEADVYVLLKPREEWTTAHTKEDFHSEGCGSAGADSRREYNFTQPMAMRLDEVVSGIKADVAVKIFGEDTAVLEQLGEHARRLLACIPGAADVQAEILSRRRGTPGRSGSDGACQIRLECDRTFRRSSNPLPAGSAYPKWSKGSGDSRSRFDCRNTTEPTSMPWATWCFRRPEASAFA